MQNRPELSKVRRVVVKVGSSTLTYDTGKLNLVQMEKLVRQLADLHNRGIEVLLVSSGAVGAGMGKLGFKQRPKTIPEKQAAAAVGQGILMHMYEKLFAEYGQTVAQVLLTRSDLDYRNRYVNAANALETLLRLGVIPVINENDTVAVDELRFGDNDTLSALIAALVKSDLLVLMTDIDGLYTSNPREDATAQKISCVDEITTEIEKMASGAGSQLGTGGMSTKIQAARIASESGVAMVIAQGSSENVLRHILEGEPVGTLFLPRAQPLSGRKRWIAFSGSPKGAVLVDAGAARALIGQGKSLLPCGVTDVEGEFTAGDLISVVVAGGREIARGISNYSKEQVLKVRGKQCAQLQELFGADSFDEIIHRDNLTLRDGLETDGMTG